MTTERTNLVARTLRVERLAEHGDDLEEFAQAVIGLAREWQVWSRASGDDDPGLVWAVIVEAVLRCEAFAGRDIDDQFTLLEQSAGGPLVWEQTRMVAPGEAHTAASQFVAAYNRLRLGKIDAGPLSDDPPEMSRMMIHRLVRAGVSFEELMWAGVEFAIAEDEDSDDDRPNGMWWLATVATAWPGYKHVIGISKAAKFVFQDVENALGGPGVWATLDWTDATDRDSAFERFRECWWSIEYEMPLNRLDEAKLKAEDEEWVPTDLAVAVNLRPRDLYLFTIMCFLAERTDDGIVEVAAEIAGRIIGHSKVTGHKALKGLRALGLIELKDVGGHKKGIYRPEGSKWLVRSDLAYLTLKVNDMNTRVIPDQYEKKTKAIAIGREDQLKTECIKAAAGGVAIGLQAGTNRGHR